MRIASLIGCGNDEVAGKFSLALTKAIISMRLVKEDCEIEVLDDAANLGYRMHRACAALKQRFDAADELLIISVIFDRRRCKGSNTCCGSAYCGSYSFRRTAKSAF